MKNYFNNARIMVEYEEGKYVLLKGDLTEQETYILQCFVTDFECETYAKFDFSTISIVIKTKYVVELLQNKEFKTLLHNPDFNILENL